MKTFNLKHKLDDSREIQEYIRRHPELLRFGESDYCLIVNPTHFIYKYETDSRVYYVHKDPTTETVFRVCIYKL